MATEVEKFDPGTLRDKISERIRTSFVDLIPEDAWRDMVQREINWFLTDEDRMGYGHVQEKRPSPLRALIGQELERRWKAKLVDELNKPEYGSDWSNEGESPREAIQEIIRQSSDALMKSMFGSIVRVGVEAVKSSLRNS